jgi:methionyl-tRNA formyltransferase
MSEGSPRIVVLTAEGIEQRYVANRLCLALDVAGVVVDESVRPQSIRRAFRGGTGAGLSRLARELFRRVVNDAERRERALRTVLGDEATREFVAADRLVHVHGVNSRESLDAVAALRPDVLLVYGTSIVRDEMLGQARDIAMNMHTGISPFYRGTDCEFWPVVNGEPERIGATVHECVATVDGGRIFATTQAAWDPGDGVHELFARAVAAGADLYVETVRRYLQGEAVGVPQDLAAGREYRGYMRTLLPELRARIALRRGLLARARGA